MPSRGQHQKTNSALTTIIMCHVSARVFFNFCLIKKNTTCQGDIIF